MENDFSDVKIGDKVFHITDGWSPVINKDNYYFYIQLKDGKGLWVLKLTTTGRIVESDLNPVVFWDEIKIIPPPKPKKKVEKTIEGWINIYPDPMVGTQINASTHYFYISQEAANNAADTFRRLGEACHIIHKYTIEE